MQRLSTLKLKPDETDLELEVALAASKRQWLKNLGVKYWDALAAQDVRLVLPSDRLQEIYDTVSEYEVGGSNNSGWAFITINPDPSKVEEIPLEFQQLCERAANKKWIKSYLYCIEQRGKVMSEMGKGPHCHMLIYKGTKRPSEVKREFQSTFKHLVGNARHIKISYIPIDAVHQKANYIVGIKAESKLGMVELDKVWRQKIGLRNNYSNEGFQKYLDNRIAAEEVVKEMGLNRA